MKTDWITDTLTELLLPPCRSVALSAAVAPASIPPAAPGLAATPRPASSSLLAGAFSSTERNSNEQMHGDRRLYREAMPQHSEGWAGCLRSSRWAQGHWSPPEGHICKRTRSHAALGASLFIAAASLGLEARAGDPLSAYMEPPVARPFDCSIAPPWRTECQGARRQSDRGPVAMTRTIQTPAAPKSVSPPEQRGPTSSRGGDGRKDRPTCNSCPDVTTAKQREYISRWKDRPLAERQAIKARQTGNGRERARDRREARDECIGDRDSARN